MMQFSVYQQSHIGGRKVNQDRMGYSYTRDALLLVLADGMGGHLRGEAAAAIVMQTMAARFGQQATPYVKQPARFLEEAFLEAHHAIHRYRAEQQLPETPRSTVVACLIQHNTAIWAHCGDSRLYWLRGDQVLGRTRDHSHIEQLIAQGLAQASERASHPARHKLYNCIGAASPPKVELGRQASLRAGDVLLLCSDGLWAMLPDEEITHRLATRTIVRAVPELIAMATAIAGAGSDNTTALAIMWQGTPQVEQAGALTHEAASVISTQMLPEDLVSTTMLSPAPFGSDVFNDDDIEQAIAEIRSAIEHASSVLK